MRKYNCRLCGAEIVWLKTISGKLVSVDAVSVKNGRDKIFRPTERISHDYICPYRKKT
jgi:hypothetical protein